MSTTGDTGAVSREEIRQFRGAVAGALGTADIDGLPSPDPAWRDRWPALAELGVTGLCVPEERGGAGFQVEVAAGIAAELGAGLSGAPFAGTVAAAHVLARDDSAPDLLAGILSGQRLAGYARLGPTSDTALRVDGAPDVDVLVLEDPDGHELLLFDDPSSWSVASMHGFDGSRSCADLTVDVTLARRLPADPTARDLFSLLLAADAAGVVERSFDATVRYAAQREAFGRPIGGFQAVQHRLSDHAVQLRGMSLLVRDAARAVGQRAPDAQRRVALAAASLGAGATPLLHELLQLTGGIGFTWEYGLHAFERRAHQDAVLLGGSRAARDALAAIEGWSDSVGSTEPPAGARSGDDPTVGPPGSTPDGLEAYRAEVRAFIEANAHPSRGEGARVPLDEEDERAIRSWLASLYAEGYLGGGWPVEWGGRADHLPAHDLVLMQELVRAGAYRPIDQVMLATHAILTFGTETQKAELLPKIRSCEHVWCQLFSEPDAGSDLASLRTRAVADGDGWKVTGQKIWSTDAHWAEMGLLLARTDPDVDRHAGITAFVIPMDLPGIDPRPIRAITGDAEFCEVFFDEVRVGPEHVLGEVNEGWRVATSGLASERAFVGANSVRLQVMLDNLVSLARAARFADDSATIEHEDVRATLADALVRVEVVKAIVADTVARIFDGDEHPADGPVAKLAYTELNVWLTEAALELLASAAVVDDPALVERWHHDFLWGRALTIAGGSSQIMRGLIGRQLLGLPRA